MSQLVYRYSVEAAHLPHEETPLHQVFKLLDADGGGTLSLREFREGKGCLRACGGGGGRDVGRVGCVKDT